MAARTICEVGSQAGAMTDWLLAYCHEVGGKLHVIDPAPEFDVADWEQRHGATLIFHRALSLEVLPDIGHVDLVLLDGDHNWYTVVNELRVLERSASTREDPLPVVALHDVGWPYGRRDLYYDLKTLPADAVRPHATGGLHPDSDQLVDSGMNGHLLNALTSGGTRNGVLTAVEDFIAGSRADWTLVQIPGLHGLALLADQTRLSKQPHLQHELERLAGTPFLHEHLAEVERHRVLAEIRSSDFKRRLTELGGADPDQEPESPRLDDDLVAHESALRDLQARALLALETERDDLRERLTDLSSELENGSAEFKRLRRRQDEVADAQRESLARIARLESERDVLGVRLEASEAALDPLTEEAERLRDGREGAERDRRKSELALAKLQAERDLLAQRLDDANGARDAVQRELDQLRKDARALDARHQESVISAVRLEAQRDALQARVADTVEDRAHTRREIEAAQITARDLLALASRLELRVGELEEKEAEALRRERETRSRLIPQLDELEDRLDVERDEAAALEERLADALESLAQARRLESGRRHAAEVAAAVLEEARTRGVLLAGQRDELAQEVERERTARSRLEKEQPPAAATIPIIVSEPDPDPADPERAERQTFARRYAELRRKAGVGDLDARELALPWPVFREPSARPQQASVSIIVCVHNALDDVRRCLTRWRCT